MRARSRWPPRSAERCPVPGRQGLLVLRWSAAEEFVTAVVPSRFTSTVKANPSVVSVVRAGIVPAASADQTKAKQASDEQGERCRLGGRDRRHRAGEAPGTLERQRGYKRSRVRGIEPKFGSMPVAVNALTPPLGKSNTVLGSTKSYEVEVTDAIPTNDRSKSDLPEPPASKTEAKFGFPAPVW